MMLAWLVIFLHGVIPHNHNDHSLPGCHQVVHHEESHHEDSHHDSDTHDDCNNEQGIISNTYSSCEKHDAITCHYVSNMFRIYHIDKVFINKTVCSSVETFHSVQNINNCFIIDTGSRPCYSLLPPRAPPSVA